MVFALCSRVENHQRFLSFSLRLFSIVSDTWKTHPDHIRIALSVVENRMAWHLGAKLLAVCCTIVCTEYIVRGKESSIIAGQ